MGCLKGPEGTGQDLQVLARILEDWTDRGSVGLRPVLKYSTVQYYPEV
jgi:hypothetical protein